jgi:Ca2+-binding EF-hand superfamily protein
MGAGSSSELSPEDIEEIHTLTQFSRQEVQRLYRRFKDLDRSNTGLLSAADFVAIPEFAINPLGLRIVALFDTNGTDTINFKQFCETLSAFRPDAPLEKKLALVFRLYDGDNNDKIERDELFNVVKRMVGSHIPEPQLWQLVDKVILDSKATSKGTPDAADLQYISRSDFERVLADANLQSKLAIRF